MSVESQDKIRNTINEYKKIFTWEYDAFFKQQVELKSNVHDDYASVKGSQIEMRVLSEIPDTLYTIFQKTLDKSSWEYFRSKKGQRWLVKEFPIFRVAKKI